MQYMEIFISWMAMTWVNVSVIIRQDFSTVAGCDLAFMPAHPSFYCRKIIYDKYGGFDLSYKIASDFECLLRFIFVHKIQTTYIPMDFVTMRTGGTSTSGFASHKQIISDHQKAFKRNGIYSNAFWNH